MLINPQNGKVVFSKVFDTYTSSDSLEIFIREEIENGLIVITACKDECTKNMSNEVK